MSGAKLAKFSISIFAVTGKIECCDAYITSAECLDLHHNQGRLGVSMPTLTTERWISQLSPSDQGVPNIMIIVTQSKSSVSP